MGSYQVPGTSTSTYYRTDIVCPHDKKHKWVPLSTYIKNNHKTNVILFSGGKLAFLLHVGAPRFGSSTCND